MKTKSLIRQVGGAVFPLILFAGLALFPPARAGWTPVGNAQTAPTSTTGNGLRTVTINSANGTATVKLPDDIRAGDTISGTLATVPNGTTKEERERNQAAMNARIIRLMLSRAKTPLPASP